MQVQSEEYTLGILPGHAPLISTVKVCELIIQREGKKNSFAVSGGVIKINDNQIDLLVNAIESEDDIDLSRAEAAKQRAENRLNNKEESIDVTRAMLALQRANNRIKIKNNYLAKIDNR